MSAPVSSSSRSTNPPPLICIPQVPHSSDLLLSPLIGLDVKIAQLRQGAHEFQMSVERSLSEYINQNKSAIQLVINECLLKLNDLTNDSFLFIETAKMLPEENYEEDVLYTQLSERLTLRSLLINELQQKIYLAISTIQIMNSHIGTQNEICANNNREIQQKIYNLEQQKESLKRFCAL